MGQVLYRAGLHDAGRGLKSGTFLFDVLLLAGGDIIGGTWQASPSTIDLNEIIES